MADIVEAGDTVISSMPAPSLLRQIVDAADMLDEDGKKEVLRKIKLQRAVQSAKKVDEMLDGNMHDFIEDDIIEMINADRRER